jgi:hypothetical protein
VINARLMYQLGFSRPVVESLLEVERNLGTAQATAEAASESTHYALGNPASFVWNSDPSGVFPAGNPTRDLTLTFYDPDGANLSSRTLRGTLASATGLITVTAVSVTGLATTYNLIDDGTASVRADVTVTFASGTTLTASLAWTSVDLSVAGGTPATGGGK